MRTIFDDLLTGMLGGRVVYTSTFGGRDNIEDVEYEDITPPTENKKYLEDWSDPSNPKIIEEILTSETLQIEDKNE